MSGRSLPSQPSSSQLTPSYGPPGVPPAAFGGAPPFGAAPRGGAPAGAPPDDGIAWGRYIAALKRFKWLIAGIIVLGTAAGVAATRMISQEYEATAMLWVNTRAEQRGPIRSTGELIESSSWVELLRSYAVADAVTTSLRLYIGTPEPRDKAMFATFERTDSTRNGGYVLSIDSTGTRWVLATPKDEPLEQGLVGDSIGRRLGMRWSPPVSELNPGRRVRFFVAPVRAASGGILGRMMAVLPEEGSFMRVSLRGTDPVLTARTLNAMMEEFVASATMLQRRKATELKQLIESQLVLAERELRGSEIGLESFRANTITLPTENLVAAPTDQNRESALGAFFQQRSQYEELRHDREQLERALATAPNGAVAPEALLSISGLVAAAPQIQATINELTEKEAQLRAARQTFTDQHPAVKQLNNSVNTLRTITIPQHARAVLAQFREKEQVLGSRIQGASRELRAIPPRTIEEGRLRRQVAVSEQLYNMLRTRYEEARLSELGASPDVKILDSAVPPSYPSSNTKPRILLLAFVASCGFAIGLALLLDRIDRRFRYPDQATNDLGLAVLGAVPHMKRSRRGDVDLDVATRAVEAFRGIRLSVRYAIGDVRPLQLAVSSPGKGDGKSFMSSNIALAFAQSGLRTLLVDGDLRRGELHRTFGGQRTPGLSDYLYGEATLAEATINTEHENLWVVPSGTRRARSPELLSSERMHALWMDARQLYDVIIIDTPPLSAGIDAFALAAQAGNLAIVLRTGTTDRKMAAAKLAVVDRLPIHVVGTVLNETPDGHDYTYYPYDYDIRPEDAEEGWRTLPPRTETSKPSPWSIMRR